MLHVAPVSSNRLLCDWYFRIRENSVPWTRRDRGHARASEKEGVRSP